MNLLKAGALASAILLSLAACDSTSSGYNAGLGDSDTKLQKAYDSCDESADTGLDSTVFEVADEGESLIIDGAADEDIVGVGCLLGALGTSQAVVSEMDSTTAMMGRQQEEDDDFSYAWSYHPDSGFQMTIREN